MPRTAALTQSILPVAALLGCLVTAVPVSLYAQPLQVQVGPGVLERVTRERFIHEGQRAAFVPFDSTRNWIHVRSSTWRGSNDMRTLTLRLLNVQARLSLDLTNRMRFANVDQPAISYNTYDDERTHADWRRRRLHGPGVTLALPAARFWEVPFVVPRSPLVPGLTWSDTLSFMAESEGLWERLDGIWHNEVLGDTVVAGRSLPLVRTRADVRYRSRELTTDVALEELWEVLRDVSGPVFGRAAIDTAAAVRAFGRDSTSLTGTAVLRLGDGRELSSGLRYERQRTWLLRDSSSWVLLQDSLRELERRQSTGMLMLPRTAVEEQLRAGNTAVADSLFARWRTTTDPDERAAIERMLRLHLRATGGATVEERLHELRAEAVDTAGLVRDALQSIGRSLSYSATVIPYLNDMGRLWRLGVLPRFTYIELANQLLRATPILRPDSTRWGCEPDVCRALIALASTAAEPRLRDVALVGAFARDPARWYARVVARADSGSLIARNAARLGAGVGATWPAAPKTSMPESNAGWRSWLTWLGGEIRWGETHADAIRMYAARTGRNPVDELRRTWPPPNDSARLVVGTILRGMNALAEPTAEELATQLLSGTPAEFRAAGEQLALLMRRAGRPAPDSLRIALLRPLLDSIAARGDSPWPLAAALRVGADSGNYIRSSFRFHGVLDVPLFLLDDGLPTVSASAFPSAFTLITRTDWDARPRRAGGVLLTLQPVLEAGPFVSVGWSWTVFRRRAENEAPSGYAGGGTLILLRTPAGWQVVTSSIWIT